MDRIIAALYTPRKRDTEKGIDSTMPRGDCHDGSDISQISLDSRRTPIASKRDTPTKPASATSRLTSAKSTMAAADASNSTTPAAAFPSCLKPTIPSPSNVAERKTEGLATSVTSTQAADAAKGEAEEGELEDEKVEDEEEDVEYTFKSFLDYRWVEISIEIQVEWEGGETTWEPEVNLHRDAPESLFAYWRGMGGRPVNPFDPDIFEVFAIRKHSKDRKRYLVEWVGYEPKEASWMTRRALEETAGDVVTDYWDQLDALK